MKLKHIIILQNKIDLVKDSQAREQYDQIMKFIEGTVADGAPVIPISAQLKYNIEVLCEYVCKKIPIPKRDFLSMPRLIVIRSFDVNKPGCEVDDLKVGNWESIARSIAQLAKETIDYSCANRRFWLSAHNCQVPTPTSQNLELEQQIRIFEADLLIDSLEDWNPQFLICKSIHQERRILRSWGWGLIIHAG